jgi:hypothetical protein
MDMSKLNIVEIGRPVVKLALPQTRCFASAISGFGENPQLECLRDLPAALTDPTLDLVICHQQGLSPWGPRWWLRKLFNRDTYKRGVAINSMFGPQLLRAINRKPLAVIDWSDNRYFEPADLFLMKAATVYFKRELPVDRWQIFSQIAAQATPSERFRRKPANTQMLEKLEPLSLGPPIGRPGNFPATPQPKTSDIFFAGQSKGASTVRSSGLAELKALAAEGFRIDIAEGRLDRETFLARAAAARLVWSPEGYGWDCFRHYEAPLCWSVPLINTPTIIRHAPLEAGVHAIYYDPEPGALACTARAALADPAKLETMAANARDHVLAHHVLARQVEYMVRTTLERAGR